MIIFQVRMGRNQRDRVWGDEVRALHLPLGGIRAPMVLFLRLQLRAPGEHLRAARLPSGGTRLGVPQRGVGHLPRPLQVEARKMMYFVTKEV